jgi:hypothetical protein
LDEERNLQKKTRDELVARILDAAAGIKNREDQLRRTTRDLRIRDMQSALRFTAGFSNIYFEL